MREMKNIDKFLIKFLREEIFCDRDLTSNLKTCLVVKFCIRFDWRELLCGL